MSASVCVSEMEAGNAVLSPTRTPSLSTRVLLHVKREKEREIRALSKEEDEEEDCKSGDAVVEGENRRDAKNQ